MSREPSELVARLADRPRAVGASEATDAKGEPRRVYPIVDVPSAPLDPIPLASDRRITRRTPQDTLFFRLVSSLRFAEQLGGRRDRGAGLFEQMTFLL